MLAVERRPEADSAAPFDPCCPAGRSVGRVLPTHSLYAGTRGLCPNRNTAPPRWRGRAESEQGARSSSRAGNERLAEGDSGGASRAPRNTAASSVLQRRDVVGPLGEELFHDQKRSRRRAKASDSSSRDKPHPAATSRARVPRGVNDRESPADEISSRRHRRHLG
jgi:hypothetical protein